MLITAVIDLTEIKDVFLSSSLVNVETGKQVRPNKDIFDLWVENALDLCDFMKIEFYRNTNKRLDGAITSFDGFGWLYAEMQLFYQQEFIQANREPISSVGHINGELLYIDVSYKECK